MSFVTPLDMFVRLMARWLTSLQYNVLSLTWTSRLTGNVRLDNRLTTLEEANSMASILFLTVYMRHGSVQFSKPARRKKHKINITRKKKRTKEEVSVTVEIFLEHLRQKST